MATGAKASRIAAHQPSDCSTKEVVGPPRTSARQARAVTETGWWAANGRSQPGIEATGTNTEEANTSGASTGNAAAWAVSGSPTANPNADQRHQRGDDHVAGQVSQGPVVR